MRMVTVSCNGSATDAAVEILKEMQNLLGTAAVQSALSSWSRGRDRMESAAPLSDVQPDKYGDCVQRDLCIWELVCKDNVPPSPPVSQT